MYRQRKRDLNLKPNRQLDKRSSRGMIYENEELRMRTIAICEDVDRGQNDIKKLRKENDHLKREIWGLRDEYEKLEEILKKVCISANIPEFQLDVSSQRKKDDSTEDSDNDDDDDSSSFGGADHQLKIGVGGRQRRESGTSVLTFDSEVGSCMSSMFGDDPATGVMEGEDGGQETGFAAEDPGSVIINPENPNAKANLFTVDVICHHPNNSQEPGPSTSFAHQSQQWSHHTCMSPPELECVTEETESAINSPVTPLPPPMQQMSMDDIVLPNPYHIMLPSELEVEQQEACLSATPEGRKTPLIHITPASSPASITETSTQSPNNSIESSMPVDQESIQSIGCITVVPKTFKVTSEIVVGDGNGESLDVEQESSRVEEFPRKTVKLPPKKQDSDPLPVNMQHQFTNASGLHHPQQRQSSYFPASVGMASGATSSNIHHRSFGMLPGFTSCCCANDEHHLPGGYQSEPSLNHALMSPNTEDLFAFSNPFQCCRISSSPTAVNSMLAPLTVRSIWNTVDKNIVIGFYGICGSGDGSDASNEPTVQEIIDELEAQFDNTLGSLQGIRLIPGRIFLSLKSASLVKSFVAHFEHDLVFKRKTTQQRIRIHFIEGTTQKTTSTLFLSGIPPELNDLTVISSLNQFGQVVAPLEKRNYKGVDISERIAKMHLVVEEGLLPKSMVVNGYNIRIRVEKHQDPNSPDFQERQILVSKTGNVPQPNTATATTSAVTNPTSTVTSAAPALSHLKPHKPVIRSCSSAPRLETPPAGAVTCLLPTVEQKRQSSVCVGNIPLDQHPAKLSEKHQTLAAQHKVTIADQSVPSNQPLSDKTQAMSTSNLQPPPKKPLARLLVSSPGSFNPSPPVNSPVAGDNPTNVATGGGALRAFYRNFDPKKPSTGGGDTSVHSPLSPSNSYSPRFRRKSSVQFVRKGGKEPLPWCGCWGLGCGN